VRSDYPLDSLVQDAQRQRVAVGSDAHQHRHSVQVREGKVVAQLADLGGTVLAVDHHEVETRLAQHRDHVLAGHPQDGADELLACLEARLDARRSCRRH
jgi:hypothetical protein